MLEPRTLFCATLDAQEIEKISQNAWLNLLLSGNAMYRGRQNKTFPTRDVHATVLGELPSFEAAGNADFAELCRELPGCVMYFAARHAQRVGYVVFTP